MRRAWQVAAVCLLTAVSAATLLRGAGGASASSWSGSASCKITVTGPGYSHTETQRWKIAGPATVRGAFLLVPSHWTDTGSGSSNETQGDQTDDISWKVNAAATGRFQFVVRASDGKLLIGQANAQLRVPGAVTGTQQQTISGVAQTPGAVDLEAFETQLPPIVVKATTGRVMGSMGPTTIHGSVAPFQPGTASVTKSCRWSFTKAGR